ncbi:hypothetical protein [Devosia sp. Root635]|uniref:hypothetical protein n=1 Tax=Devosia sp. Root635 TaxID=1736575 RepID=UPI000700650B|nr:hypothetical protein [Devosia sp. Root635]KRA42068.1 hypothetical protein ASD80_10095 [Devosia sp. Root635]
MTDLWFLYPVAVLATLAIMYATHTINRASHRRQHDLAAAAEAIKAHYDALYELLDDDDVPENLKSAAYAFHKSVTDRGVALEIANFVCSDAEIEPTDAMVQFDKDVEAFRLTNRPAYDRFRTIISSGMAAMLLRWPETADVFERAAFEAAIESERQREISNAVVVRSVRSNKNHDDPHFGGTLATA